MRFDLTRWYKSRDVTDTQVRLAAAADVVVVNDVLVQYYERNQWTTP